jgi:hypothetical protein
MFYIAHQLHMTVAELEERATMAELIHWNAYFNVQNMRAELSSKRARNG